MLLEEIIEEKDKLKSISLKELGVKEIAFLRTDALMLLLKLKNRRIAIVGGDVYEKEKDLIKTTYDSWYCNQETMNWDSYVEKSYCIAKQYISTYRQGENKYLYSFVVRNEENSNKKD